MAKQEYTVYIRIRVYTDTQLYNPSSSLFFSLSPSPPKKKTKTKNKKTNKQTNKKCRKKATNIILGWILKINHNYLLKF